MKFGVFITFIFLIYEPSFYSVIGQTTEIEPSDCTKLLNFLKGDKKNYDKECCDSSKIECDEEGYIINYKS